MAISTYTELQTAITRWLNRTDLSAVIPDFITLAETKINRDVRAIASESIEDLSTSTTSRFVALPAGTSELLDLSILLPNSSGALEVMTYYAPSQINWQVSDTQYRPSAYTVRDQIELNCKSDQVYTLKAHILGLWDIATDGSNWLLTNAPDVYLYGSLAEAAPYIKDDARIALWSSLYAKAVRDLNESEARTRKSGPLVVDDAIASRRGFNILRGW